MRRLHFTFAQRGLTLVMSLVMLVMIALLGLGAARYSTLDHMSARASRDREVAMQSAEAALRDAMADIESGLRAARFDMAPSGFGEECPAIALPANLAAAPENARGLCLARDAGDTRQLWQDVDLDSRAVPFGTFTQRSWDTTLTPAPVYIIETLPLRRAGMAVQGTSSDMEQLAFRITAVGFGPANSDAQVALQSYFVKTR